MINYNYSPCWDRLIWPASIEGGPCVIRQRIGARILFLLAEPGQVDGQSSKPERVFDVVRFGQCKYGFGLINIEYKRGFVDNERR